MINEPKLGEELVCPVCGEIFEVTTDTKYIITGEYTCDWKCFFNEVNRRTKEKNKTIKNHKTK